MVNDLGLGLKRRAYFLTPLYLSKHIPPAPFILHSPSQDGSAILEFIKLEKRARANKEGRKVAGGVK